MARRAYVAGRGGGCRATPKAAGARGEETQNARGSNPQKGQTTVNEITIIKTEAADNGARRARRTPDDFAAEMAERKTEDQQHDGLSQDSPSNTDIITAAQEAVDRLIAGQ